MADDDTTPETEQADSGRRRSGRSGRGGRAAGEATESSSGSAALANALRELVGSIEHEVAEVTRLSEVIDDHVVTLNGLRADVAQRLLHLDELRAAADDANLGAFLDDTIQPQLPQQAEDFPDRIYGS